MNWTPQPNDEQERALALVAEARRLRIEELSMAARDRYAGLLARFGS